MRWQQYLNQHPGQASLVLAGLILVSWLVGWLRLPAVALGVMYLAGVLGTIPIALRAWSALRMRTVSIELLVTIACVGALAIGEPNEAAIVTFLFLFGNVLEARTLAKTRSAVRALTDMAPQQAAVVDAAGHVAAMDIDDIEPGMHVRVRPGDQVPVDGTVVEGTARLVEAVITGEAAPVAKTTGDQVYAGATVDSGALTINTTAAGEDSTFGQIVALVEDAQDAQAPVARFIDRFARYYTPAVMVIALLVGLVTLDVRLAITMLVLGCPGALVIGAPVANVAGIGRAASQGILFKGGATTDALAGVDTIMLDKTGTITTGKMTLSHLHDFVGHADADLALLAAIEADSQHPLAQAIMRAAREQHLPLPSAPAMTTVKGRGLVSADGRYLVGNLRLMQSHQVPITGDAQAGMNDIQRHGDSVVLLAVAGQLRLAVGINDVVRPDAAAGLTALKQRGIQHVVMLTGDNHASAQHIAAGLPIDSVQAELLPADKLTVVRQAQAAGHKVAFVGDGINDAPALATADVGIGMGGGTAVALDTADVVLVRPTFATLTQAVHLARATRSVTRQNIVIAVGTVALLLLGLVLGVVQMASGMLVHEASILVVIANALRLLHHQRGPKTTQLDQHQVNVAVTKVN
ncbi:heavy metal translocating P-type ATPase [Lacticaseibacillus thailandensis]|nr:heavy metal translocating P-type ATPase [Lacticaseibacillus thailandensis]